MLIIRMFILSALVPCFRLGFHCEQVRLLSLLDFYQVQTCSRSTMKVIASANLTTPARCALFALQKKGLAFNFSPPGIKKTGGECIVLDCPEYHTLSSLKKDWRYDYYSLYGYPLPSRNFTCIPKVGLFELNQEPLNFKDAVRDCRRKNSDLAHILSEIRTTSLSGIVKQLAQHSNFKKAYVNLQDIKEEGVFKTTIGEPLSCYDYRAWGPSEPRDRSEDEDCVVLDAQKQWKVVGCSYKLPYICELWPGGENAENFTTGLVKCSKIRNEAEREKCIDRETNKHEINKFKRCWKGITFNKRQRRKKKKLHPLLRWKLPRNIVARKPSPTPPPKSNTTKPSII